MSFNQYKRVFGAGTSYLSATDLFVEVDTTLGVATIYLPKISELFDLSSVNNIYNFNGIRFVDIANNAAINNIILKGKDGDLVNGLSEITLNTNGVGGVLIPISELGWSLTINNIAIIDDNPNFCSITLHKEVQIGIDVNFTKTNYGSEVDTIDTDIAITRGDSQSIFNIALEPSYNFGVSPLGTLWNWSGWGTLEDIKTRTYVDFRTALLNQVGSNVVGAELVMWDTVNDKYYKVLFSQWTQGGYGGGFSYTRNLVTIVCDGSIHFPDGSVLSTANLPELFTPKILYVNDINGNDSTAEVGYPSKPYASIDAATNAATTSDVIMVERGTYYISTPFKPNVVYNLGASDIFGYTTLIQNSYGSGSFKIYGKSNITNYGNIVANINDSDAYVECNSIKYFSGVIGGTISNSNIIIKSELTESLNNGAFHTYLEGASVNVNINLYSVKYILHRGFISWFNGNNPITINIYGTYLTHIGLDFYASLAWILGDGMSMNFYVNEVEISANSANSFFPWYGILNVYSKIKCITDISWIMADGGVSTFYADINAPLGLLYVRGGANATVILKELTLTSNRDGNSTLVSGNLNLYNSTIKSTDTAGVSSVINLNAEASRLMLNNSKIIADATKPSIENTSGFPNLVKVYGSCYSVSAPVSITQAPETITQYASLN